MTAIVSALSALSQSLENLETASSLQEEKALKLKQQDLFNGNSATANGNDANGHMTIDASVLAQKLDVTIERVEQILREG